MNASLRLKPLISALLLGIARVAALNAIWMLAHAMSWFAWIPGVSDTGTPNGHFIRDVGIAFAVAAGGLVWVVRHPQRGCPVLVGITLFVGGHALGHVIEILTGYLPMDHWWVDFPLVFAPAIALAVISWPSVWDKLITTSD